MNTEWFKVKLQDCEMKSKTVSLMPKPRVVKGL